MRPVNRPKRFALPPRKLYREDLEGLLGLFQKHCKNVTLMDESYAYDSVEEMSKGGRKDLGFFHLTGLIPHVELWVKGHRNSEFQRSAIFVPETSDSASAVFLAAKEQPLARRWRGKIYFLKTVIVVSAFVLFGGLFLKDAVHTHSAFSMVVWNLALLAVMALLFASSYHLMQSLSVIRLEYRASETSFWNRNKDDIARIVIGAIIGIVLTLIVAWIKSRYFTGSR